MQIALSVTISKDGEIPIKWISPYFDTSSSTTWGTVLQPTAELYDVHSDADVAFELIGDHRIKQDPSWADMFNINSYQNEPSLSYNVHGIFEYKGQKTVKFFKNSARTTYLRFRIKANGKFVKVFEIPVTVVDRSGRWKMYLTMLREVVAINPGLALPDDDRMVVPRLFDMIFSENQDGDTAIRSDLFEYRGLCRDLDLLVFGKMPILPVIEMNPMMGQKTGERYVPFGNVRHITRRQLNAMWIKGIDDQEETAEQCTVTEDVFLESSETLANRAIRTFLDDALRSLYRLKRKFNEQYEVYDREKRENPKTFSLHHSQRLGTLKRMVVEISDVIRRLRKYIDTSVLWRSLTGDVDLLYCRSEEFNVSQSYLQVYGILYRHYMRKHWLPTNDGTFFTLDYEVREKPFSKGRQRSFSFLYESWVFVRLLQAFSTNGFRLDAAYSEMLHNVEDVFMGLPMNESVDAHASDGALQVRVTYGVTEMYSETPSTPDFAIEFEDVEAHARHVIILDAKAVTSLDKDDVYKRDGYLRMHWKHPQEFPNQSWLVYIGEREVPAKVEFSEGDGIDLHGNFGLRWCGRDGIEGAWKRDTKPVGHLRVNCDSIATHNVFDEFVAGQIATARRHICGQ